MTQRDTLLGQALACHEAGRLAEAEAFYHRILALDASDADALHLSGVLAHQTGRSGEARALIGRAIAAKPDNPVFHNNVSVVLLAMGDAAAATSHAETATGLAPNYPEAFNSLGNALKAMGQLDRAADSYRAALRLKADYVEAWFNFGNVLYAQWKSDPGKLGQAINVYRHAIDLRPGYVDALINLGGALNDAGRPAETVALLESLAHDAHTDLRVLNNLGNAYKASGRFQKAVDCLRHALALDPGNVAVLNNLGNALQKSGDIDGAIEAYASVLAAHPEQVESLSNLGNALQMLGRLDEAIACYDRALAVEPDFASPRHNLGMALRKRNRLAEAEGHLRRALALKPDYAEAMVGLGSVLDMRGHLPEATLLFRRALDLRPGFPEALAHMLFALSSSPGTTPDTLRAITEQAVGAWEKPGWSVPIKRPDPSGRLRIGYVSADLRNHPVGHFLGGVLRHHDRMQVEVFCYGAARVADEVTARLQGSADHWRDIAALDAAAAALVAEDGIDILVDLAGHTAENRLGLFMGRAAPVQASWMGFFGTTGLPSMDYLIADAVIVPPGEERHYTETIVRLPGCYLSFDAEGAAVPVSTAPWHDNGFVTFGCFNRRDKITPETVAAWCAILDAVPGSRLLVKNGALADAGTAEALLALFLGHGLTADRIALEASSPRRHYLADYGRIDVALDPFPFCGGTTTAETLWMGVPLVSLRGPIWAGRISASMLTACGHAAWIAEDVEDYRRIAVALARDPARLDALRAGLRAEAGAGFCDGAEFTRGLEQAYRRMAEARSRSGAAGA